MGTKYSAISVSGYNAAPPPDDGTQVAANRVDWSKVKGKIGDPLNTFCAAVDTALQAAFDYGATAIPSSTTIAATHHAEFLEITSAVTVTLTDAATLGASWYVWLKNSSAGNVTVARASAGDTIDESASNITLSAGDSRLLAVNAGLDGFIQMSAYGSSGGSGSGTNPLESYIIPISDETTAISATSAVVTLRMPYAFTLTEVPRASLSTASSSGTPTFDIKESGTTIFSTKITIDENEKTSTTAATPAVLSDASIASDAELTINIDVAGTGAKGAKITLIGRRT